MSIVAPVFNVRNSVLLAISTLDEKLSTVFAKMLKSDHVNTVQITLICKPCLDLGIRVACKHNKDFEPSWIGGNSEVLDMLMDGHEEQRRRETMGVVLEDDGPSCFTVRSIENMLSMPRITIHEPVQYVYIDVDPSGGSDIPDKRTSDFCIVSMCSPYTTILGIDTIDAVVTQDYEAQLLNHLNEIRKMPMFANCVFVIDAESGTGYVAGDVELLIQRNFENTILMSDFTNRKPGTLTTHVAKREMMEMTRSLLDMGDVRISNNFITSHKDPKALLREMGEQFKNYDRVVTPSKSISGKASVSFTGKHNGRDDIVQTVLRAIRSRWLFRFGKKYQRHHI